MRAFAADRGTERALRAGLAGHDSRIDRLRFPDALRMIATEPAPRILFVDIDGINPDAAARELTAVCVKETDLITIGSTNTAKYSRTLFQSGVKDYLVKPISPLLVRETCAGLVDESRDRLYAGRVVSCFGTAGCGTSTLIAAVACEVAAEDRAVSIVDLDPISAKVAFRFGVEPSNKLSILLDSLGGAETETNRSSGLEPFVDTTQLDTFCTSAAPGISLVAYSQAEQIPSIPSPQSILMLLRQLANRAHVVLITGIMDPGLRLQTMKQADSRVLVFEPTLTSVRAVIRDLALLGTEYPVTLVQCHTRTRKGSLSLAHVQYALADRRPDVVVPFEPTLHMLGAAKVSREPRRAYREAIRNVKHHVVFGS